MQGVNDKASGGEGNGYPVRGCIPDVSKYQGNIDWKSIAEAVDFVIIRVQDNKVLDSKLERNIRGATANNVPYALYAFFRAATEAAAKAEADLFFDRAIAAGATNPLLWYIDVETKTTSWANQCKAVCAYAARLRSRGAKRVGLYTYNSMFAYLKGIAGRFDDVWIAHYGKNNGVPSGFPSYPCGLHQYTSMAGAKDYLQYSVPGIDGRVDLNRLTGDKALSWYTGRNYCDPPGEVKVTGLTVHVRSGPGKDWTVEGIVKKGTLLTRMGADYDGWYGVEYRGDQAYISAKYARIMA